MTVTFDLHHPYSDTFFIVASIFDARTNGERAAILLRLPDEVIAARFEEIQTACREVGFQAGADFLNIRLTQHCATRTETGAMPKPLLEQYDYWRWGLAALAGVRA